MIFLSACFDCSRTFLGSAGCTHTENIHRNSRYLETFKGASLRQRPYLHALRIKIGNLAAAQAHQVVVLAFVRLNPKGTVVHAYFAQHPALDECTDVLINRSQRN
jgi:hypothetical protein